MTIQVYPEPSDSISAGGVISSGTYGEIGNRTNFVIAQDNSESLPPGVYEYGVSISGSATAGIYIGSVATSASTSVSGVITSTASGNFKLRVQSRWEGQNGPITSTGWVSSVDYINDYLFISGAISNPMAAQTGGIYISTNNDAFTLVQVPATLAYNVIYDGSFYIAGHRSDGIVVSTNLTTWTSRAFVAGAAAGIGRYEAGSSFFKYIFAGQIGHMIVSTNGTTWTTRDSGLGSNQMGQNLRYLNGNWFTFASTARISMSTNGGNNWNVLSTSNLPSNDFVQDIAYGNGVYTAASLFGNIVWSTDGINWTTSDVTYRTTLSVGNQLFTMIFADGYFVSAGATNQSVYTSTNGNNWQVVSASAVTTGVSAGVAAAISVPSTSVNYPTSRFYLVYGVNGNNMGPTGSWRLDGFVGATWYRRWSATLAGRAVNSASGYVAKKSDINSLTMTTT
jgi:hypothetical protein